MENKKLQVRIGDKLLSLDNADQVDEQFCKAFEEVAQTNPSSIQEFFERLAELQQPTSLRIRHPANEDENSDLAQKKSRKSL